MMADMSWLRFAIVAYLVTVLQTSLIPLVFPMSVCPNVMLVAAVYYMLTAVPRHAMVAAVIIGVLGDLTSSSPLGTQVIGYAGVAILLRCVRPLMFAELPMAHAFGAFAGFILLSIEYRVASLMLDQAPAMPSGLFVTLLQALSTGVLAAIICKVFVRRLKPRRQKRF